MRPTTAAGDARTFAREAAAGGCALVVAWGGDGTVNEVAAAVMNTSATLAIVPAGSGNGLARDLGLPSAPARALEIAAAGSTMTIDAGQVNDCQFFNIAGVGVDAIVAARFAERGLRRRGLAAYVQLSALELARYRAQTYRLTLDGDVVEHRAMLVAIANGRQYGNRLVIAPGARLDDGLLEVVIVDQLSLLGIAWRLPALLARHAAGGPRGHHSCGAHADRHLRRADSVSCRWGATPGRGRAGGLDPSPGAARARAEGVNIVRSCILTKSVTPNLQSERDGSGDDCRNRARSCPARTRRCTHSPGVSGRPTTFDGSRFAPPRAAGKSARSRTARSSGRLAIRIGIESSTRAARSCWSSRSCGTRGGRRFSSQGPGSRPQASGLRPQASGFRGQASGARLQGPGFRGRASGARRQASGLRLRPQVSGAGFTPRSGSRVRRPFRSGGRRRASFPRSRPTCTSTDRVSIRRS